MNTHRISISPTEAQSLLGLTAGADDEQVRQAYLSKVREFPPDKDPEAFERIRDAYELLKDRRTRARQVLHSPEPYQPLPELLAGLGPVRHFVGPRPWIDALREKMKESRT